MHHAALDRARAHDGDFDHQVVVVSRFEAGQHGHLRARFDLEHADAVRFAKHVVHRLAFLAVFVGEDVGHGKGAAVAAVDQVQREMDSSEHAQRQHIDFKQAEFIEVVFVPLDDGAVFHGGVLGGDQLRQQPARNDETAHMLRQVARESR